ncbi:MAG: peptidase domain-containing ABC transporter [Alphaproteobacteria bacterium]
MDAHADPALATTGPAAAIDDTIVAFQVPTALACLAVAARHRGLHLNPAQISREEGYGLNEPDDDALAGLAGRHGLELASLAIAEIDARRLASALPALLRLKNGNCLLLIELAQTPEGWTAKLYDPAVGEATPLVADWTRIAAAAERALLVKSAAAARDDDDAAFGIGRLAAEVRRERRLFRDVAVAAALMSVTALAPALFWQLVVDRVLVYKSLSTLHVLVGGLAFIVIFDTLFGYLRRSLVLVASARIDARLSSFIFGRLLGLGIGFFERTPTGTLIRDVNEIWRVRNFLTGQLFGTLLDAIVLLVVLPVMFWFSPALAAGVLGIGVAMMLAILAFLPFVRRSAGRAFEAEGRQNAYLVESVQGIRAVKSMAMENRRRRVWDGHAADAARLRREAGGVVNALQTVVTPFEKLMTSGIIAVAAYVAVASDDPVHVGALIAFGMLTQRVAQPLIQLAYLVQQFDEVGRALRAVAGVVNQPREDGQDAGGLVAPLKGAVTFDNVRFRYPGASGSALDGVSFKAAAGAIFGIMGRSGSGKTTVTRLLQALHRDYDGLIKIDGTDIRAYDLGHLRRSTGVVLQDSFLFSGTIRDNIAAGAPGASFEQVVAAARLAGAEEFIERLPRGYDTLVEENGSNLSGGQKQRLAIARALIVDPALLILDEATSALDPESEAIVNANLRRIASGRTVIVISHRLSSLVQADAILALDHGKTVGVGPHEQLLRTCDLYRRLWQQQNGHALYAGAAE